MNETYGELALNVNSKNLKRHIYFFVKRLFDKLLVCVAFYNEYE